MKQIDNGIYKAPLDDVMYSLHFENNLKTVLNLETHTRELIFGNGNDLFLQCLYKGVRLYDMAWSGILPPRHEDVLAAIAIILYAPKPLAYGCRAARERAGYLTAVYRILNCGWDFELAYNMWKVEGCRWPTYLLWKRSLRYFEGKTIEDFKKELTNFE